MNGHIKLQKYIVAVVFFISALSMIGCNPEVYRKPAEDFHTATVSLKEAYFLEWELSNTAMIQRANLEDEISIWTAPPNIDNPFIQKVSEKMKQRQLEDVHGPIRPLREKAFAALEGYAEILVYLASNEPTETIVTEINALVKDIEGVLDTVSKIEDFAKYADEIGEFTGPLQEYLGILSELTQLISSIARERAIVQTIGDSNDSVLELLKILKEEAVVANENTQLQIINSVTLLDSLPQKPGYADIDNVNKATIAKRTADLKTLQEKIGQVHTESAFDAAAKAQAALVKKAYMRDTDDWAEQIREFKNKVTIIKENIEKIESEM
ncbi:MAG: hypothetical protein ACYSUT_09710 [Planctomycetota bacterium]|jgi:hypothetical protein